MNEYEMYLGVAAFVFYAKKYGFEFIGQGKNSLTFNYSGGRYYFCKIMPGKKDYDCGYVVVNINDFKLLFGNDDGYIKDLKSCERLKLKRPDGTLEHCRLDPSLWGKIEVKIDNGKTVKCLHPPQIL
jgi:hypothetical protein